MRTPKVWKTSLGAHVIAIGAAVALAACVGNVQSEELEGQASDEVAVVQEAIAVIDQFDNKSRIQQALADVAEN